MLEGAIMEFWGVRKTHFVDVELRKCTSKSVLPKSIFCTFPKLYFYKIASKSQNTLIAPLNYM